MKRFKHREFFFFAIIISGLSVLLFGSEPQMQADSNQVVSVTRPVPAKLAGSIDILQ